ncbi:hypothetical protein BB560_001448 [Smittium megazygosporum]|uniref:Uncharacterized protein n=1 Tax=Smittium megazygosporum TaxID=133381 RepID=A0A2T9ZGL9_9FUNG|nr:hypothetical protein BB560_001803 [Smittium megazygosporum]PVV04049.1 hypothetical protein BB560_001448 [Smittium megazygosporum]
MSDLDEIKNLDALNDYRKISIKELLNNREIAKNNVTRKAIDNSQRIGKSIKNRNIDVGTQVLLRNENKKKLDIQWYGPFEVVSKTEKSTYKLKDNKGNELPNFVHGNRLKIANVSDQNKNAKEWKYPKNIMRGRITLEDGVNVTNICSE